MSKYLVRPVPHIRGDIRVPGDKSISHRSLMLGSIADGVTEATGFLESEDCLATMRAMTTLGVQIERPAAKTVRVHGVGLRGLTAPRSVLDMGNSGTAMRLMTGLLAGQPFDSELIGDSSLMKRPMERAAAPLRLMGARIETREGKPPVRVRGGTPLKGMTYELPVASAQVKSALLLAALYADGPTVLTEPAVTRDHTERMLLSMGCELEAQRREVRLTPPGRLQATSFEVPGDFSSSAFFIVAGCIAAKDTLVIRNVGINPTRTGLLDILALMGADLRLINHRSAGAEPVADIEVHPCELKGAVIPPHLVPLAIDEFPAIFVAAACASGETVVTGAEELRVKESDRIAVMADGLKALGIAAEVLPDGMRIQGSTSREVFRSGTIDSHGDHRIAMSFTVASARAAGPIEILDVANVATSFPDFIDVARRCGFELEECA
jgi:3-phosphoshikimate 1-carboxyvinyltransferase